MRRLRVRWGVLGALVLTLFVPALARANDRPFTPRFVANQPGDITIVGNVSLTCGTRVAGTTPTCAQAQAGAVANNNDFNAARVDVDGVAGTASSSRATLAMPAGATVLFAGLYWGGRTAVATRNTVKFQPPGQAGYTGLTATTFDAGTGSDAYQGFVNVTASVAAAGNGVYTVADVQTDLGANQYGAWALVVAYGDPAQAPRNLSVFDGFESVNSSDPPHTITVNGFTTPPAGAVKTTLGAVVYEGDLNLPGDSMSLNATTMSNAANPATNNFNSSITDFGIADPGRTPSYVNNLGFDADLFNADGILANNATSATIKLTTNQDQYFPGVVTFATELYAPVVVPSKSVANVTHPTGPDQRGDTLRYTLSFHNTGQDDADGFVVTDPIPAGSTYKPGSLRITAGPNAPATPTDGAGDDLAEFDGGAGAVRFRMGTGATSSGGGRIATGATVTATFDVTVDNADADGFQILNRGSSDYRARTLGTPFLNQLTPQTTNTVHAPDLALSKTHTPAFVSGATTTFTFVASNVGTLATDGSTVTVTDSIPAAGFDSISNADGLGWSCSIAGLSFTCTRSDSVAAGASYPAIYVDARVKDPAPATITNTATVSGGGDLNTTNNTATDGGGTTALADVQLEKSALTPVVASGDTIGWEVRVRNAGPSTATSVNVTDTLAPANYDQVVATSTQGTCTTTVTCNLGSLAPGAVMIITIHARVLANNTTLTNTASASSPVTDPVPGNNSAQATATVLNTADLSIVKTGAPPNPAVNTTYTYTLAVSNAGPGTATDVVVSDQLPAALGSPSVTPGSGWTCNSPAAGGLLTCTRSSLAVGAAPPITVSGTVLPAAGGTFFSNSAAVDGSSTDPNPGNNSSHTTELATPAADLSIVKAFADDTLNSGDTATVTLTITNNGPSAASSVTVHDTLPLHVTPTIAVASGGGTCVVASPDVDCSFTTIPAGQTRTVTITATVSGPGDETVVNTASVASATPDPVASNNSDSASLTIGASADISLEKTANPQTASVGDNVTYTLTARNAGPSSAAGVAVHETLPSGMTFVSASAGCTGTTTITCSAGTITAGGSAVFTIVVTVGASRAGDNVANIATVDSTTPHDPDPSNNTAGSTVTVAPRADLSITKSAADTTPDVNADDTFTLRVTNNGPNTADDVTVSDPVPGGLAFVAASPECSFDGSNVTCLIGTLANGATRSVTVTLRAGPGAAGLTIPNVTSVSSTTPDPSGANNTAVETVTVEKLVDLVLTKSVTPSSIVAGDTATYLLVVTNKGPSAATSVTLSDPIPAGLTVESTAPTQGSCTASGGTVTCSFGTIAAGGGAQVLVTVRAATDAGGKQFPNTATVDAREREARPGDNTASATLSVTAQAPQPANTELRITKTVDDTTAETGQTLTYTITVENRGAITARDVTVTDTFSALVEVLSRTPSAGTCSGAQPVTCKLGDLAAGATATIKVTAQPRRVGTFANNVTVTSPDSQKSGSGLLDDVTSQVRAGRAVLSLRKTASTTHPRADGLVTFTLTLRSLGPATALNVHVCDRLPRGLSFVRALPGATFSKGQVCWRYTELAKGAVRTLRLVVRVAPQKKSTRITNVAIATATGQAPRRAGAGLVLPATPPAQPCGSAAAKPGQARIAC